MPDGDGLDIIQDIRTCSSMPIIILSELSGEQDKINIPNRGADNYLDKPFGIGELLARVN